MSGNQRYHILGAGIIFTCGLVFALALLGPGLFRILTGSARPTPDFESTLQALTVDATASSTAPTPTPTDPSGEPTGRITYTCQLHKSQASEQICLMNADGSDPRQLTQDVGIRHFYPSMAPGGSSVVYSQYREDNVYEIYDLNLGGGTSTRLTDKLGVLTGPEISPDEDLIAFMRWTPASNQNQIWLMDRDGGNPRRLFNGTGWDPTWSPDGKHVLFASDASGTVQLYRVDVDGNNVTRISDLPAIRGRSDWSPQGLITTYSGESWQREIFIMQADGSQARQISAPGGNSQGPSFSPDGQWIAFTAYFDRFQDIHGCEIYIMRRDGTDLRRLTNNDYCDYQPRWGP